jgi:hypothetical protein
MSPVTDKHPWRIFLASYTRERRCTGVRFIPRLYDPKKTRADFRVEYAARILKRPVELVEIDPNGAFAVVEPKGGRLLAYLFEYREE